MGHGMGEHWDAHAAASLGAPGERVTLVEGAAFVLSAATGDVTPDSPEGLYFRDSRFLSRWSLEVNGERPEVLATGTPEPYTATFVGRARARQGQGDPSLMVLRHRYVGRGMREDLVVRNFAAEPAYCALTVHYGADFAALTDVKKGRSEVATPAEPEPHDGALVFRHRHGGHRRALRIDVSVPAKIDGDLFRWEVIVPPGGEWSLCQQFTCSFDDEEVEPRWLCGQPINRAKPAERMAQWRRRVPVLDTDHEGLRAVVAKSAEDLGALRIFDPDYPERTVLAAGAPWSMTLFGRDSLLTAWMALLVDPELALGTLQTLARFQGSDVNPHNEEEPGRILHELGFGESAPLSLGGGHIYYGTADATPLFVMLLGELRRWGLAREAVDELLPHADRAIDWIERFGDRDGDGYVEYQRTSDRGLRNQGWKDSDDAVRFADGALGEAPIALAEVQGYVYGAYLARAFFAAEAGDAALSASLRAKAATLKAAFNRDFWIEERGWLAMGLDRDKRPLDALTSNIGHCLWTGIVDADKADVVAKRLLGPDMFSGWGVRTLASSMAGYNPLSYHCGSVWPHDNAIVAAGLMRYGHVREAQRIVMGVLDAAVTQGGRLPELFSGLDRLELPMVVPYPTSCSPQAWSAASPLLMLRTLLRLDPWVPRGKVWLHPALPERIGRLHVGRIPLAGSRVSVTVEGDSVTVDGLPDDLELVDAPRHPLTGPA
ncbi:MAG TPA: glycogen debranching N-terminal domain-containing protein [Acidimicrobiales bacterium]|nr:glycogen debranching N-terminal domain-containing protein [Acidimicrobiales bacterium]